MWIYQITSGDMDKGSKYIGRGYSGFGPYRNDPGSVTNPGRGPIPEGLYRIGPAFHHPKLGPVTMRLTPLKGTVTYGRSGFCMHGDNKDHTASHGCIIVGPAIRSQINKSTDRLLKVVD